MGENRPGNPGHVVVTPLWKFVAGVAITTLIGVNTTYFAPVEIGAVMDRLGVSAARAGGVISAELAFVALISLLFADFLSRVRLYWIVIGACLLTVIADGLSALPGTGITTLTVWRAIAGVGSGFAFAISCIWTARSSQPARVFSIAVVIVSAATALVMTRLSTLAEQGGVSAVFMGVAGLALVATLPLFATIPSENIDDKGTGDVPARKISKASRLGLYMAIVLANLSFSIIWQYAERLGHHYGFAAHDIGSILALASLAGVLGPVIAAVVGDRFGNAPPFFVGMIVAAVCGSTVSLCSGLSAYAFAIPVSQIGYLFVQPYMISFGAWLDPTGRAAAFAGGLCLTASAISPIVGGMLVDWLSARASGWACAIFAVLTIVFLLPIGIFERRSRHLV